MRGYFFENIFMIDINSKYKIKAFIAINKAILAFLQNSISKLNKIK